MMRKPLQSQVNLLFEKTKQKRDLRSLNVDFVLMMLKRFDKLSQFFSKEIAALGSLNNGQTFIPTRIF